MTIEITEATRGMWSAEIRIGNIVAGNWLGHLRAESDGSYWLDIRLRWYRDDKPHDSKDRRVFASGRLAVPTEAEAIDLVRVAHEAARALSDREVGWELLRGARPLAEFVRLFEEMPGISGQKIPAPLPTAAA
jgi:hypothetical protein